MKKYLFFLSLLMPGFLSASAQVKITSGTPCEIAAAMTTVTRLQLRSGANFRMQEFFPEAASSMVDKGLLKWTFLVAYPTENKAKEALAALSKSLSGCLGVPSTNRYLPNHYSWQSGEVEIDNNVVGKIMMLTFRKGDTEKEVDEKMSDFNRELLEYTPPAKK